MTGLKITLLTVLAFLSIDSICQQSYYQFTENKGQFPAEVKFSAELENGMVFFENDRFTYYFHDADDLKRISSYHGNSKIKEYDYNIKSHAYQVVFENSNVHSIKGSSIQKGLKSYFRGNDQSKWASGCLSYGEITYENIYPGIDLNVYAKDFLLKYEYIVYPGSDPALISQVYQNLNGIKEVSGRLILQTNAGKIQEERPVSYQKTQEGNYLVKSKYHLKDQKVGFEFPESYNSEQILIIDPELIFSTYSGSTSDNFGYTAAFDDEGFLYSGSSAFGTGYPTTLGAFEETWGTGIVDIALSKVDTTGTFFVWSAYLGGDEDELPHSIMVNDDGELYVLGTSSSSNFPTTSNTYDETYNGGSSVPLAGLGVSYNSGSDIILARISASGDQLLGSTYVGGSANDGLNYGSALKFNYADEIRGEIQLDDDGNVFVVSSTYSEDFPVSLNAVQQTNGGELDAVAFLMSPDLSNLEWSTYVGGSSFDAGYSLTFDQNQNVIICGGTQSTDLPVTGNAVQGTNLGGDADGFFTRIINGGQGIDYGTYYGSEEYDQLYFIETDETDQVYVFGQTEHSGDDFIQNAAYNTSGGGQIITKFDDAMTSVVWSTAFGTGGGQPNISPTAFLVDVCDRIYLSGWGGTTGGGSLGVTGMDTTPEAYDDTSTNGDFYLMVLFDDASDIFYGSFYGGASSSEHVDGGTSRFNRKGQVYQAVCAGCGSNDDFPIEPTNAISPTNNSANCNLGVFKFDFQLPLTVADFIVPDQICVNQEFEVNNESTFSQTFEWNFGDGSALQSGPNPTHIYDAPGTYEITLNVSSTETCNAFDSITKLVTIEFNSVSTAEELTICAGETVLIGPGEISPEYTYEWTPSQFLSSASEPNPTSSPLEDIEYVLTIERGACIDTLFQSIDIDELDIEVPADLTLCEGGEVELSIVSDQNVEVTWAEDPDFISVLNDGPMDYTINPIVTETSTFFANVEGENCTETHEVNVEVISDFIELDSNIGVCAGDPVQVSVLFPNENFDYTWTPNEIVTFGQGSSQVEVLTNESTILTVSVSESGCELEESIEISVINGNDSPLAATADPSAILLGQSSQLSVNLDGLEYDWEPSGSLSNSSIQNPVSTPSETTTYTVEVGEDECTQTAQVTVFVVDFVCGDPTIYVPNAFSPNGDGENDVLFVYGQNELYPLELIFRVYNRWGQKVFETSDFEVGWDGYFNEKLSDPAVFDYYLEVKCEGGEEYFEKGNITLVR